LQLTPIFSYISFEIKFSFSTPLSICTQPPKHQINTIMETVNKYVHAASNAIWGQDGTPNATQTTQQHGEEPLSGVQGSGDATDPYDAGNRDGKCIAYIRSAKYLGKPETWWIF
jgi:hypothetical protein